MGSAYAPSHTYEAILLSRLSHTPTRTDGKLMVVFVLLFFKQ